MQPALVKYDERDGAVEVQEVSEPQLRADRVLLRVDAAGVCGSDLHMWRQHHSWPIKMPLVLGHEFCAVIEDVEATIYSALGINWTSVRYDDPFGRGFEYVPKSKDDVYGPIHERWA